MLNIKNFALSGGILWALSMLIMTILNLLTGYGTSFLDIMTDVYPGYEITWVGSIVGLVYGFFDGFIGLAIFAWLYNLLNKCIPSDFCTKRDRDSRPNEPRL